MSQPYTRLALTAASVNGTQLLFTVPSQEVWVVRCALMTVGAFALNAQAGVGFTTEGPWAWLWRTELDQVVSFQHETITWEGRLVLPAGTTVYSITGLGVTCDMFFFGWILST